MINLVSLNDEELVKVVREENKEFYSEIIKRYQTKLGHYLRKFIKNSDELEDVLQEVFIKAYRNLYDFNTARKFSPWIYRIAHNEALNHLKKYQKESISLDEKEWEIIDEKMSADEKIDAKFTKNKIEEQLFTLKEKYRAPLILYFFEDRSYEEISEILRLPRSTVGTLIMRGKGQLKELLEKEKYE